VSDEAALARIRKRLAARVISATDIRSDAIAAALRDVPRHLFLPELAPESAYRDEAIVTKRDADGQPISSSSQPAIMAIMLDQLALAPGLRVLEIGAGTGYNAALMKHIVGPSGTVVSVDIDAGVAGQARDHLVSAGYPDVTVVAADGAQGYPPAAPYDRVIATVGVSDLALPWLDQTGPGGRIVVPFDVRGTQLAAAFERAGDAHWASVSLVPCGFMRMRGSLAGPERTVFLQPGLSVMLPDGLTLADGKDIDAEALAAQLAGPSRELATGVQAGAGPVLWGLGLWLAAGDLRSCTVAEERPARSRTVFRLQRAPLRRRGLRLTTGILDSGGIAMLTTAGSTGSTGPTAPTGPTGPAGPAGPQKSDAGKAPGLLTLTVTGFGPHAPELAAGLAAQVRAWDQAGQPGVAGLHVDAWPRSSAAQSAQPAPARDGLLIERPSMGFAVYHA
jgi:protein-L-isoaspartate(D-aspartate) O-methyltransferase